MRVFPRTDASSRTTIDPPAREDGTRDGQFLTPTQTMDISHETSRGDARLRRTRNIVLVSEGDAEMAGFTPKGLTPSPIFGLTFDLNIRHATKRSLGARFRSDFLAAFRIMARNI